ncbi:unnamed protein product, partial [Lymnaea stagnalis]
LLHPTPPPASSVSSSRLISKLVPVLFCSLQRMKPLASLTLMTLWALAQNVYSGEYPSNDMVKCGRRVCAPEAACRNNSSCRCKPPYIGVGHVKCFNNDSVSCHVIDDPYLKTFCGEKA